MLKAIFWDNDGVLVDTEHLYFRATQQVLDEYANIALNREDFVRLSLQQGRSVFALASERGFDAAQCEQMRQKRNALYAQLLAREAEAIDGVEETLQTLSGQIQMAIVTSSLGEHFDIIHHRTGLLKYFDFWLTRETYQHTKPDPEPYLSALERSGLNRSECLVIEDTERGLKAALAAGIACLVIPGELTRDHDFTGACKILQDIRQLPAFLGMESGALP